MDQMRTSWRDKREGGNLDISTEHLQSIIFRQCHSRYISATEYSIQVF